MVLNWGIVGAGDIAHRIVAPAMRRTEDHRLVAVARRNLDAARQFAMEHQAERFYGSAEELCRDPDINAVYIGTPPAVHAEETLLAAQAGKHVLCEKPIATSPDEARRMIDACRAHGVRLMICHYQRWNERHRRIRRLLEEGAIGRLSAVRLQFSSYSPERPGQWRRDPAISGGGPLMDLGSHCLDLLMFLCGPIAEAKSVVSRLDRRSQVEDTATLLLRLESGAHVTISTHWSARLPDEVASNAIELLGSEGAMVSAPLFSKDSSGSLILYQAENTQDLSLGPGGAIHDAVLRDFRHAIMTGGPVGSPAEDAVRGLEIIAEAYRNIC